MKGKVDLFWMRAEERDAAIALWDERRALMRRANKVMERVQRETATQLCERLAGAVSERGNKR
jgi:hypothetical protein